MRSKLYVMLALVVVACWAGAASATTTYNLNLENSGAASANNPPFGEVTVSLTGSNTASIEYTTLAPSPLSPSNDIWTFSKKIGASVNGAFSVSSISVFTESGPSTGTATWNSNPNNGEKKFDGFGDFDMVIDLPNAGHSDVDVVKFTLTKTSGSWASEANVFVMNSDGYYVAAHENADFGPSGNAFYTTDDVIVPLSPSAILLGYGLLGLAGLRRFRKG